MSLFLTKFDGDQTKKKIYIYIYNRENYQAVHNWCVCQISDDTALNLANKVAIT